MLRDGVEVATSTGATSWVDAGVANDTTYERAGRGGHPRQQVPGVAAGHHGAHRPIPTAPAAPTGLAAAAGDGQVALSWTASPEPDLASYRLLRDGTEVAVVTSGTRPPRRRPDRRHSLHVHAGRVDTHGNRSAASVPVQATAGRRHPARRPDRAGGRARRRLGHPHLDGRRRARPRLLPGAPRRRAGRRRPRRDPTTRPIPALTDDTPHGYALVAVDTSGNSSAACAPVWATPADRIAPAVPAGLTATAADGRVTLTWTAGTEADLASYRVLRDGAEIATVRGSTGYLDGGLVDGTTYSSLRPRGGTRTATGRRRPRPCPPPRATRPRRPRPAVWSPRPATGRPPAPGSPAAEPDLATYRVLRGGTEVATVPAGTTSWTDTGLTDGTTYAYALVAVDTADNRSAASTAVWATPIDTVAPSVPTGLAATPGLRRITLTWTPVTDPDLATYRVLRDGVEVVTILSGTGWVDTGLPEGSATPTPSWPWTPRGTGRPPRRP